MKPSKSVWLAGLLCLLCLTLYGCMNSGTPSTTATPNPSPMTGAPETNVPNETRTPSAPPNASIVPPFDWNTNAASVEGNLSKISEVSAARVLVTGTTALVGVRFTSAYQGNLTPRLREIIAAEVRKADPAVQTVAVTAENNDVNQIFEMSDRRRAGESIDGWDAEIEKIVRNATTLR